VPRPPNPAARRHASPNPRRPRFPFPRVLNKLFSTGHPNNSMVAALCPRRGVARARKQTPVTSAPPAPFPGQRQLIVTIGPLPDAMEPGFHGVRTPWIRGFMPFQLAPRARIVMLMVSVLPESGLAGRTQHAAPSPHPRPDPGRLSATIGR